MQKDTYKIIASLILVGIVGLVGTFYEPTSTKPDMIIEPPLDKYETPEKKATTTPIENSTEKPSP